MKLPQNSIIVSGPVIIEKVNGRLCTLLNKKLPTKKIPRPKWQFCGGEVEDFDGSLEQTAQREAKEEMGIDLDIDRLIDVRPVKRGDGSIVILVHYLAKRIGEIAPNNEIKEWRWFPLDQLPQDSAPNIKPVIAKSKKILNIQP